MDLILNNLENDDNDDDYSSYFLQPASSPYNIAEKVQQANIDLFNGSSTNMEKTFKVTFKEQPICYEPELLTDDDVNSIESDQELGEHTQILEYKSSDVINLNIFNINEEEEIEEVIEEIVPDEVCATECEEKSVDEGMARKKSRKKMTPLKPQPQPGHLLVECKNHCIERLDFDLSMSIKKLEIHEKPCPLLKLQKRQCCDDNRAKNPTSLPCYNGHRSEYGLSSAELERREQRRRIIKLKEQKRQELIREYKNRKNQQNEEVFCRWLKDVAKRKAHKQRINSHKNTKQCFSPNVISLPTKCEKSNERPKTANEFVPRQHIKRAKRPHTSPACVFIEVPQKLLERGIHLGDLLVTNGNFASKKINVLTVGS